MKPLSTPYAILIGAVFIAIAILFSNGFSFSLANVNKMLGRVDICENPQSDEERLTCLAQKTSLDTGKFKSCLASSKHKEEIAKDQADAEVAGMTGTPGFVIGKSREDGKIEGIKVVGAYPYATFKTVIDGLSNDTPIEEIIGEQTDLEAGSASVDDDAVLGKKEAPITIIEFSDYECPFCKRHFTQTVPSLKKDYIDSGKAKLVYRDFIAVGGHNPSATTEAIAANCAREQGGDEAYYKYHDQLFQLSKSNGEGIEL